MAATNTLAYRAGRSMGRAKMGRFAPPRRRWRPLVETGRRDGPAGEALLRRRRRAVAAVAVVTVVEDLESML